MKINFNTIDISNFLSIGNAKINLDENGYTLVNGVNKNPDDMAKSNGSGKSSIWEAISWCLTGETIRGSKDVVNLYGDDGAKIELDFNIDNDNYKIIRTKDHSKLKTNLKIYINGEDKSGKGIRDTEKLLAEYLPDLTSSLLGSVIILGQGLPQRFSNNSPSGRKEVLEKLSKSDFMIEDLKNRISDRKSTLNAALRFSEDTLLQYKSTKELLEKQINENKIKLESLSNSELLDQIISDLEAEVLDCTVKVNSFNEEYDKARLKYQETSSRKNELNEELVKFANNKSAIQQKRIDLDNLVRQEIDKVTVDYDNIAKQFNKDYLEASSELKTKKAELIKMQNVKDTCPTCGQKLPGVFKPDTTEIETAISSLTDSANDAQQAYNNTLAEMNTKKEEIKNSFNDKYLALDKEVQVVIDKETQVKTLLTSINSELNNIATEINKAKEAVEIFKNKNENYKSRLTNAKLEKENLESNRAAAQNIIDSNTKQIEEINTKVISENEAKESVEKHLEVINKMNTAITREFRGYLLANLINFINTRAKEYSLDVFETDKIDFSLDGNNISITYDGKDYQNLSGGEKQKVDIIVQFAIRDMLCKYLNFSSNILVLDEICDNVDSIGAERLFNMISRKLSDVQNIFIVSHHTDFPIPCDRQLAVIKDTTKISRIEYVA